MTLPAGLSKLPSHHKEISAATCNMAFRSQGFGVTIMSVLPQDYPTEYQKSCNVVEDYEARMSMVPKEWPTGLALNENSIPMDDPPQVPGGICNFAMPDQSTRDRYLWVRFNLYQQF